MNDPKAVAVRSGRICGLAYHHEQYFLVWRIPKPGLRDATPHWRMHRNIPRPEFLALPR